MTILYILITRILSQVTIASYLMLGDRQQRLIRFPVGLFVSDVPAHLIGTTCTVQIKPTATLFVEKLLAALYLNFLQYIILRCASRIVGEGRTLTDSVDQSFSSQNKLDN